MIRGKPLRRHVMYLVVSLCLTLPVTGFPATSAHAAPPAGSTLANPFRQIQDCWRQAAFDRTKGCAIIVTPYSSRDPKRDPSQRGPQILRTSFALISCAVGRLVTDDRRFCRVMFLHDAPQVDELPIEGSLSTPRS